MATMEEMLGMLVRLLVQEPAMVRIETVNQEDRLRLEIHVAESDVGRVIGRQGKVIRALRVLMRSTGARVGRRVEVELAGDRV